MDSYYDPLFGHKLTLEWSTVGNDEGDNVSGFGYYTY